MSIFIYFDELDYADSDRELRQIAARLISDGDIENGIRLCSAIREMDGKRSYQFPGLEQNNDQTPVNVKVDSAEEPKKYHSSHWWASTIANDVLPYMGISKGSEVTTPQVFEWIELHMQDRLTAWDLSKTGSQLRWKSRASDGLQRLVDAGILRRSEKRGKTYTYIGAYAQPALDLISSNGHSSALTGASLS